MTVADGGIAIPVLRSMNSAWRDGSTVEYERMGRLLAKSGPDELRETAERLALFIVGLTSMIEERDPEFSFAEWATSTEDFFVLKILEAQFTEGDAE